MNILLVNILYPPDGIGGSEQSVRYVARGLLRRGHEVTVVCQGTVTEDVEEELDGVRVVRLGAPPGYRPNVLAESPDRIQELRKLNKSALRPFDEQFADLLDRIDVDVIAANVTPRPKDVWTLADERGIPLLQVLRSYSLMCRERMFRSGYPCPSYCDSCAVEMEKRRISSTRVRGIIGISEHMVDAYLQADFFRRATVIEVIPNSYEPDEVTPLPRLSRESNDGVIFGYLGRLHETKGLETVIEAFLSLDASEHQLFIGGTGNPNYVANLKRHYAHPRVEFVGYVPCAEFLNRVDALCVPSQWHEPFGRVNMESLHHGRPVLGSNRGGIPEIIQDGETGFLFEPSSVCSLSDAMTQLTKLDTSGWKRLEKQCLDRSAEFSVDVVAERYENAFRALYRERHGLEIHS